MKREIKFRAFLNSKYYEKPCMLSWEELLEQYDAIDMFQRDLMTLMQFTGLHDKNGREIYESDIVRVSADGQSYVSVVLGPDGDYPAFDLDMKYIPDTWYYEANVLSTIATGEFEEMEVIGNVHQNPELLEASK